MMMMIMNDDDEDEDDSMTMTKTTRWGANSAIVVISCDFMARFVKSL